MDWLTLTLWQRDWKIVIEYWFKWYSFINLEKIPNFFNLRDLAKSYLIKETITTKFSNFMANLKTKIPFFKKSNSEKEMSRPFRSINIPFQKEKVETKTAETIS